MRRSVCLVLRLLPVAVLILILVLILLGLILIVLVLIVLTLILILILISVLIAVLVLHGVDTILSYSARQAGRRPASGKVFPHTPAAYAEQS